MTQTTRKDLIEEKKKTNRTLQKNRKQGSKGTFTLPWVRFPGEELF